MVATRHLIAVALLATNTLTQAAPLFTVRAGTVWEYETSSKERKKVRVEELRRFSTPGGVLEAAVIGREDGSRRLLFGSQKEWYECQALTPEGQCENPLLFLRAPMRVGDRWTTAGLELTVLAQESITVPAGKFSDAWRVEYAPAGSTHPLGEMWFAPTIGRVRIVEEGLDYQLVRFTEGVGRLLPISSEAVIASVLTTFPASPSSAEPQRVVPQVKSNPQDYFLYAAVALSVVLSLASLALFAFLRGRQRQERIGDKMYASEEAKLAVAVAASGDTSNALERMERLILRHPSFADLRYQLGILYQAEGRWEEARKSFDQALTLNPDYFDARLELARLFLATHEPQVAEKHYAYIVERRPTFADAQLGLGKALLELRRMDEASKALKAAFTINPNLKEAQELLRECSISAAAPGEA